MKVLNLLMAPLLVALCAPLASADDIYAFHPGMTVLHTTDNAVIGPVYGTYTNGVVSLRHNYPSDHCDGAEGCHEDETIPASELAAPVREYHGIRAGISAIRVSDGAVMASVYIVFSNGAVAGRHNYPSDHCDGQEGCHEDEVWSAGDMAAATRCFRGICRGDGNLIEKDGSIVGPILSVYSNGMAYVRHPLPSDQCGGADGCHNDDLVWIQDLGRPIQQIAAAEKSLKSAGNAAKAQDEVASLEGAVTDESKLKQLDGSGTDSDSGTAKNQASVKIAI